MRRRNAPCSAGQVQRLVRPSPPRFARLVTLAANVRCSALLARLPLPELPPRRRVAFGQHLRERLDTSPKIRIHIVGSIQIQNHTPSPVNHDELELLRKRAKQIRRLLSLRLVRNVECYPDV